MAEKSLAKQVFGLPNGSVAARSLTLSGNDLVLRAHG